MRRQFFDELCDWRCRRSGEVARRRVARAIAAGTLAPAPCLECAAPDAEAHHPDYSRPLDVDWLCRRHHADHHQGEA